MKRNLRIPVFLLLICAFLLLPLPVSAHKPIWTSGPDIRIPNLSTSFAAYRTLADSSQVDRFVFDGKAGQSLRANINVPQLRGLASFAVRAALVGPGLPEAEDIQLPVDLSETLGVLIFPSEVSPDFFEPFTQTSYWGRQQFAVTLPEDGVYYLFVWQPADETGKYVLATGGEERFSPTDLLRLPLWWVRVHVFFDHTPYLVAGGVVIALMATILILRRRHMPISL